MSDLETAAPQTRSSLRLFCALDPPPAVADAIVAWQRREAGRGGEERVLRAVRREALHLTLTFLGELPAEAVPAIAAEIEALPGEPIEAEIEPEPVPLPARRPRLLALPVRSPGAVAVRAELAERLRSLGAYEPESRPFWPHLTVFRLRGRGSGAGRRSRPGRVAPFSGGDGHAFGFVRAALYRSELGPEGSTYYRLAARELSQPGGRQKR